jgi:hypothetical protein
MAGTTRRTFLAGLVAAGFASGLIARPAALLAALPALRLPVGAMWLERELVRSLGDGQAVTVRRSWDIGFAQQARGIVVSGAQVAVSVDAPENLAALARIEEQRDTAAMFPIMLSDNGRILAGGKGEAPADDLAAAMRAAERMIVARPQSEKPAQRHPPLSCRTAPRRFGPVRNPARRSVLSFRRGGGEGRKRRAARWPHRRILPELARARSAGCRLAGRRRTRDHHAHRRARTPLARSVAPAR